MSLDDRQQQLLGDLRALRGHLDDFTRARYGRSNPFVENLFDWGERGRTWTHREGGITIFDSATLIGDVEIGNGTWIGQFCLLDGTGGLQIGAHCSISFGAQLLTHDTVRWALTGGAAPPQRSPTRVGDCCFIGTHAVVVRGVTVGDFSVVGAGAVVTGDVPPSTIVAGVPARKIGAVHHDGDDVSLVYD